MITYVDKMIKFYLDEEPKLKGKVHALNFGTGKYDFIKDFEEGAALGFSQSGNSDETIARFKDDIDRMTDKPSTATVEEIMYMLKDKHDFGIEQPDSLKVNEAKIIIEQGRVTKLRMNSEAQFPKK